MNKIKLALMVGVAAQMGLSAATARAESAGTWQAQSLKVYAADPLDTARVQNGRLRKTRYEETNEMPSSTCSRDGKTGLYVRHALGRHQRHPARAPPAGLAARRSSSCRTPTAR